MTKPKNTVDADDIFEKLEAIGDESGMPCRDYLDAIECAKEKEGDLIDANALIDEVIRIGNEQGIPSVDYVDAIEAAMKAAR